MLNQACAGVYLCGSDGLFPFCRFPITHQKLLDEQWFVGAGAAPVGDDEPLEMVANELLHELAFIHIHHGGVDAEALEGLHT